MPCGKRQGIVRKTALQGSAHGNDYVIAFFPFYIRDDAAIHRCPVNGNALDALFYLIRIDNLNAISPLTELPGNFKIAKVLRDTRVYA